LYQDQGSCRNWQELGTTKRGIQGLQLLDPFLRQRGGAGRRAKATAPRFRAWSGRATAPCPRDRPATSLGSVSGSIQESTTFSTFSPAASTWNIESTSGSIASRGVTVNGPTSTGTSMRKACTLAKPSCAHHVEQFVEQAVDVDRRRAVQQVEALERAVVVVEVGDEDGVETLAAGSARVVETHGGNAWQLRLKGFSKIVSKAMRVPSHSKT
jgi:hypothetical protein